MTIPRVTLAFDPPGPLFAITEQAAMPAITVTARLHGVVIDPGTAGYRWRITLGSDSAGCRHAMGKVTSHPDIAVTTAAATLRIPFAKVRGGALTVGVAVSAGGSELTSVSAGLSIIGTNPGIASLAAATKGAPDAFKRLMRLESALRQFRAATGPLFSADNLGGVGLCQLTPPDSDDQIWDWKANVRGGRALYREKESIARAYAGKVRAGTRFRQQIAAYHARIGGSPLVTVPDYTAEQLELDTIRAFNGFAGGLHEYRLKTDGDDILVVALAPGGATGTAEWERISAAERTAHYDVVGIGSGHRGDPDYVDHVLKQASF